MNAIPPYQLYADIVLIVHVAVVLFVVGGLLLTLVGGWHGWHWVRNLWFRLAHLGAVAVVVLDTWLGVVCPLTSLEMELRARAGGAIYEVSFIEYWLQRLLYYQAPPWAFLALYTTFGVLVVATWWWVRPRRSRRTRP